MGVLGDGYMGQQPDPYNRFRILIAYEGTNYHGWAVQENLPTVAGEIERVLRLVSREKVHLTAAGRTDKGVHALGQVAHFDLPVANIDFNNTNKMLIRLNKLLPADIRIVSLFKTNPSFDARFSALARTYIYRITTASYGALPQEANFVAHWTSQLDLNLLNKAASLLVGLHDFAAFCKPRPGATTIRNLQIFTWERTRNYYIATVKADAFCWSMVRSLVGAVTSVATGKRSLEWCASLLTAGSRDSSILVAPAVGLTLQEVDYPPEEQYEKQSQITRKKRTLSDCDCVGGE